MYTFIYKGIHVFPSDFETIRPLLSNPLFFLYKYDWKKILYKIMKTGYKKKMGPSIVDTCRSELIYIGEK